MSSLYSEIELERIILTLFFRDSIFGTASGPSTRAEMIQEHSKKMPVKPGMYYTPIFCAIDDNNQEMQMALCRQNQCLLAT